MSSVLSASNFLSARFTLQPIAFTPVPDKLPEEKQKLKDDLQKLLPKLPTDGKGNLQNGWNFPDSFYELTHYGPLTDTPYWPGFKEDADCLYNDLKNAISYIDAAINIDKGKPNSTDAQHAALDHQSWKNLTKAHYALDNILEHLTLLKDTLNSYFKKNNEKDNNKLVDIIYDIDKEARHIRNQLPPFGAD